MPLNLYLECRFFLSNRKFYFEGKEIVRQLQTLKTLAQYLLEDLSEKVSRIEIIQARLIFSFENCL